MAGLRHVAHRQLPVPTPRRRARHLGRADRRDRAAGLAGALHIVLSRRYALAGWLALMVLLGVLLTRVGAAWSDAKTLMLSSPVFILLAWAGVSWLRAAARRYAALALSVALVGGRACVRPRPVPRQRPRADRALRRARPDQQPLRRPRTDAVHRFDEYALYELRDMDIGGLDFIYPPVGFAGVPTGHGGKVDLNSAHAAALRAYPCRHAPRPGGHPPAVRIPAALAGDLLPGWGRSSGRSGRDRPLPADRTRPVACSRVRRSLASPPARCEAGRRTTSRRRARRSRSRSRSANWKHVAIWVAMTSSGHLRASVRIPTTGIWNVWLPARSCPRST